MENFDEPFPLISSILMQNCFIIITRLISIEPQPKKIVVEVVVVIGFGVVVVHVVAVVIPVVDTRNIHNKVWLKPGY